MPAMSEPSGHGTDQPRLRVVRGDATPEEIAALLAVVGARTHAARAAKAGAGPRSTPVSRWADRSRQLRRPLPHGPDAWRAAVG